MRFRPPLAVFALYVAAFAPLSGADESEKPSFHFDDYLLAPIRVHLLHSTESENLRTTLADADIQRIVRKVNGVWSQAGIAFYIESIVEDIPATVSDASTAEVRANGTLLKLITPVRYAPDAFNVYYLKRFDVNGIYFPKAIFVKDTASLRAVEGGIDEPLPRVTSHELGHALGLPHRQDTFNLMASGTTGTILNAAEIAEARKQALALGRFHPARELVTKADTLANEGSDLEARTLYLYLSSLALDENPMPRIRAAITDIAGAK